MRLIDADALIRAINQTCSLKVVSLDNLACIIGKQPTVDAVPVVRCKDCKHCEYASNRIPTEQAWVCYKWGIDVVQDWFCADGERKDDE